MITVILFWLYSFLLCYLYGWMLVRLFSGLLNFTESHISLMLVWLSGLSLVVSLASILSLLVNIGLLVNILMLGGALAIAVWGVKTGALKHTLRQMRNELFTLGAGTGLSHGLFLFLMLIVLADILFLSIGKPANPDSGIYHAQSIRWIETYRAVPGLGNIHTRLAYNSSWMLANALFSFSYLGGRSLHLIGSSLFVMTALYSLGGLSGLLFGKNEKLHLSQIARTLLLPFMFVVLGSEVSSPGSDMPAALITWVVVSELLALFEQQDRRADGNWLLLVLCAAFGVTIKLSHAPLLLLTLVPLWNWMKKRRYFTVLVLTLSSALVLLPWCARNVVLSGYLVYPFPALDLFDVDWKIPREIAQQDKDTILSWTRPWLEGQDVKAVLAMPLEQWAPIWFDRLTLNRKMMAISIFALPLLSVLMSVLAGTGARQKTFFRQAGWVYGFVFAGLLFWFFNGPAFRFGYGFIIPALVLGVLACIAPIQNYLEVRRIPIGLAAVLGLLVWQGLFSVRVWDVQVVKENLVMPADYPSLPTHPCEIEDATLWCADVWEACWYDVFPCVPNADAYVSMRGESLEDGFVH